MSRHEALVREWAQMVENVILRTARTFEQTRPGHMAALAEVLQQVVAEVEREMDQTSSPAPPVPSADPIEELLASLDAPGPEEPRAWEVLHGALGSEAAAKANDLLWRSRDRVRTKIHREMRERGKDCSVCGGHFKPGRITQHRCPDCIRGGAR